MSPYTQIAKELFKRYEEYAQIIQSKKAQHPISTNEAIGTAAFMYEKMRTVVDYKDEQLLKKDAIKRIITRRFRRDMDAQKVADALVRELIRSRYLPNNERGEADVLQMSQVLEKYLFIYNAFLDRSQTRKRKGELKDWLLRVAAAEIDDLLFVRVREHAFVQAMYKKVVDKITIPSRFANETDRKIQIFIAIHKALVKSDKDIIRYNLLRLYHSTWTSPERQQIEDISNRIEDIIDVIEGQLDHKMQNRILNIVRKYAPPFLILRDIFDKHGHNLEHLLLELPLEKQTAQGFDAPTKMSLDDYFQKTIQAKYNEIRNRLRRRSVRAVIYLLITKIILTVILEIPYDLLVFDEISYIPLAINLIFHPLLVFALVLVVRPPKKQNTVSIIRGIKEILLEGTPAYIYTEKRITIVRRNIVLRSIFTLFYAALFIITYGAIIMVLRRFDFNAVSMGIFIVLASTVSFFGVGLRSVVKEYVVANTKQGIIAFLFDLFSLPIVMAGRWLSINFSRINVFVFILDVIIEAPFQTIIELVEEWIAFIREKREEVL
jgi:hypothetical protein